MLTKKLLALAASIAGLSGATVGGIAAFGDSSSPPATTVTAISAGPISPSPPPQTRDVDPALSAGFAIFRGSGQDPATVPSVAVVEQFGANPSFAREAKASDGSPVFAVPGNSAVCVSDGASANCGPTAQALVGGAFVLELCSPTLAVNQIGITGLMPDGVQQVQAANSGGGTSVTVVDNVYHVALTAAGGPATLAWRDAAGADFSQWVPIPPDYSPTTCSRAVDAEG